MTMKRCFRVRATQGLEAVQHSLGVSDSSRRRSMKCPGFLVEGEASEDRSRSLPDV